MRTKRKKKAMTTQKFKFFLPTLVFALMIGNAIAPWTEVKVSAKEKQGDASFSFASDACTSGEKWQFSSSIQGEWREEFESSIGLRNPVIHGLAESMALQEVATSDEAKLFAVYWKNRSLFQAKLIHIAINGFNWIAAQAVTAQTIGIQTAALECLNQLYYQYPRIHLDPDVVSRIPEYQQFYRKISWAGGNEKVLFDAASILVRIQLSENRPDTEIETTLRFLKGSGPYESLARGMWLSKNDDYEAAIPELEEFLKSKKLTEQMQQYKDGVYLTLSRMYHVKGKYGKSIEYLKMVNKNSNHMVRVLAELGSAYMLDQKYKEAVGTALNFQMGGFQKTFAPDAIMTMAMALNELCHYPTALKSVGFLRRFYRPSYYWLRKWYDGRANDKNNEQLYKLAVRYLETEKTEVPMRVMSEWLRSPVFISHQEEMNLLMDERGSARSLQKELRQEYKRLKDELVEISKKLKDRKEELKEKLREEKVSSKRKLAKRSAKSNQPVAIIDDSLKADIAFMKRLKTKIDHIRKAVKPVETIQNSYLAQTKDIERKLVQRINTDLSVRNLMMMKKLKDVAENTYLIEVEIYNGASEDVVWQNAHPEFKPYVDQVKKDAEQAVKSKVYNWGPLPTNEEGFTEIWADELGNMMANVEDNCSNRDKYLTIQLSPNLQSKAD